MAAFQWIFTVLFLGLTLMFIQMAREIRWVVRLRGWDAERYKIVRDLVGSAVDVIDDRNVVFQQWPLGKAERSRFAHRLYTLSEFCDELRDWETKHAPPAPPKPGLVFVRP